MKSNPLKLRIYQNVLLGATTALALFASSVLHAAPVNVTVAIGSGTGEVGTQLGAGAFNTTKDNLDAEAGELWGVSNSSDVMGLLYFTYSDLAGATLPSTIQAGTYTFSARIGNGNAFDFAGLNTPADGDTTGGSVAGFFETAPVTGGTAATQRSNAQNAKNNMAAEFNNIAGVTYTAPTEAAPENGLSAVDAADNWTTWTFTWEVAEGSSVIGKDLYFGVYTKTGGSGSAFWDDSTLTYAVPEPSTYALLAGLLGLGSVMLRRRRA